jgi:hypothetical protein
VQSDAAKDYDNESRYYSLLVSTYDTTKGQRIRIDVTACLPDVASTPGMEVETEATSGTVSTMTRGFRTIEQEGVAIRDSRRSL